MPVASIASHQGEGDTALAQHPAFDHFTDTVKQLCDPETGCPWNRTQTHDSLSHYLIEEAYETLDAIQAEDVTHLREELGDVLLQVVLQSQIAANAGEFDIDDVVADIDAKMIRRHPHVFGDVKAENENEVALLWEQVKLAEKRAEAEAQAQGVTNEPATPGGDGPQACDQPPASLLDDVPIHFPALMQAQKISRRAAAAGFEWDTLADVWAKVDEERAELIKAYDVAPKTNDGMVVLAGGTNDAAAEVQMEFGDLLFALVNVARRMGIDAEAALSASNAKFRRRFAAIEQAARTQGKAVQDLSLNEMEAAWQQAKEKEAQSTSHQAKEGEHND